MAATDPTSVTATAKAAEDRKVCGSILMAALALPGLMPVAAQAENAPERAVLSFKQLYYQDAQPGFDRIQIIAPSVYGLLPLGPHWSAEASAVYDMVSGASPRYYSAVSGASKVHEKRVAADAKVNWYGNRSAVGLAFSRSDEHDYLSYGLSADARVSTADNNLTFNAGLAGLTDKINPTNQLVVNEHKTTVQGIVGVTYAASPVDLLQLQTGYASGHGYYSDAYKLFDNRPRSRTEETALLRWNHHLKDTTSTIRGSYRLYHSSWGVLSHTVDLEWVQPVSDAITLTPGLRYYTQSAAKFYIDPPADGSPFPVIPDGQYSTLDQRQSAYGAVAANLKVEWRLDEDWSTDLKGEYYQEHNGWRLFGTSSPGLASFNYVSIQFGITRRF